MWYVMQVISGREELTIHMCNAVVSKGLMKQCFIPHSEKKYKHKGRWITIPVTMFPGYVFIETQEENEFLIQLKLVPEFTKVLGTGYEIVALQTEEVEFLKKLMDEEHTIKMSEGIILGDRVIVYEGPLQGKEGFIRKIDRKKRMAILEIEFLGRKIAITVGLEIVMKYQDYDDDVTYRKNLVMAN